MKRYERKYIFNEYDYSSIRSHLKSNGYKEHFSPRVVNSIYYDDQEFSFYNDSIEGIANRKKIRIRFYNKQTNSMKLEYKYKIGDLISKRIFDDISSKNYFSNICKVNGIYNKFKIPKYIEGFYSPKVLVSYERDYFYSYSSQNRITIDKNIVFSKINFSDCKNQTKNYFPKNIKILEVKHKYDICLDKDIVDFITNQLNGIFTNNSKYCEGINRAYS